MSCDLKADRFRIAAEEIAGISGAFFTSMTDNAQAVFDSPCGLKD